ncbi:hypothetical protein PybrP1_004986 [[Pythium] brassicae (nom. inval.)]|nr:hypothetical protein PybrP1_004986 [[Pythium] brassicae (nom. inval.)]
MEELRHASLPPRFVAAVRGLHDGTSSRFLVNCCSLRGIRQGCPLTPMLFIMSLVAFYIRLAGCDEVRGVRMRRKEFSWSSKYAGM